MVNNIRIGLTLLFWALPLGLHLNAQQSGPDAQLATLSDANLKASVIVLVTELQSKALRQTSGDKTAYFPQGLINPTLAALGEPKTALLSTPVQAQGLSHFNVRLLHANGVSEWSISVLPDGNISSYDFLKISPSPDANQESELKNDAVKHYSGKIGSLSDPEAATQNAQSGLAWLKNYSGDIGPIPGSLLNSFPEQTPLHNDDWQATMPPPPKVDPRVVEFLFATTRAPNPSASAPGEYFTGERGPLSYGAASIRIPENHRLGRIELPGSYYIFGFIPVTTESIKSTDHFIVKSVKPLEEKDFDKIAKSANAKSALIFIHGHNTPFQSALFRNAQIVWDLQYPGLSVLYTWASREGQFQYANNKDSALLARDGFIRLVEKLRRDHGINEIHVLAHSMGNLIALEGLASYARTSDPVHITNLIMAAPDVDRNQFETLAPAAKAIIGGMTLYASSADRAIAASRLFAGNLPRAGDVTDEGPVIVPNVDTYDVTALGDEFLGINHDTFVKSRTVMQHVNAVIHPNSPLPRLFEPVPLPPAAHKYWRFLP